MFSRTKATAASKGARRSDSFSVIGPDVIVTGDLATGENLQVSGRIDGDVKCAALHQSENGAIAGNVIAGEVRLAGVVHGTVTAGTVVIEASARVTGEVSYTTLSIESGARVDGRLTFRDEAAAEAAQAGEISFNEIFPHEDATVA